ncbi:MAG: substrate-binding domain-containing protein [Alsobacter sp.]
MDALVVLQSMATRRLLEQVVPAYSLQTGTQVVLRAMGGVEVARLVRSGESGDVVILAEPALRSLAEDGLVLRDSLRCVARAEMVAATPAGRQRPDMSSGDAVRRAIMAADKVAFSTGPSGDHLMALCAAWGIPTDAGRFVKAPAGVPVGSLLAEGAADLGFQQRSELLGVPGVEIVGSLPPDVAATTAFLGGIAAGCRAPRAAADLLGALASPGLVELKRGLGLEPG